MVPPYDVSTWRVHRASVSHEYDVHDLGILHTRASILTFVVLISVDNARSLLNSELSEASLKSLVLFSNPDNSHKTSVFLERRTITSNQ